MPINFHFQDTSFDFPNQQKLENYILQLFNKEGIDVEHIDYIFCPDEFLLPMNKQYLDHDTYTDILTFDLSEEEQLIAEIYISVDRVKENAASYDKTFTNELHRVIFHGALHLCGYDDHSKEDKTVMRQKEDEHLLAYFKQK